MNFSLIDCRTLREGLSQTNEFAYDASDFRFWHASRRLRQGHGMSRLGL
jgi:hypothetical protein